LLVLDEAVAVYESSTSRTRPGCAGSFVPLHSRQLPGPAPPRPHSAADVSTPSTLPSPPLKIQGTLARPLPAPRNAPLLTMSSLSIPPPLLRSSHSPSPAAAAAANWRRRAVRVRVRAPVAALAGDGGCAGTGMEQHLQAGSASGSPVREKPVMSNIGKSTNILWHDCPIGQTERQKLLGQKGCVIWITGLSGSGKSTVACALSRELHYRGHHTYVLDGDNLRHGLNRDLSFKAEDRTENIRRVGKF
uniref:APS kinase domain-containing protein n=3 Tax=Aegilops tauschii subsp. strangulata TaxID=200361 RepID=A0A453IQC8_AEGTS